MRKIAVLILVAIVALVASPTEAKPPLHSFETVFATGGPAGPDGYFGLGAVVAQEPTIGVTHLDYSMKYTTGTGGFVGARVESSPPALNNPPGVSHALFDIYIDPIPVAVTFADIGIVMFGHELDGGNFGIQMQFADTISLMGLGAGPHLDQRIDLDNDLFTGDSFNEIFGDDVSDLDVASAFQFYISKSAGPGTSMTVYIDNVRVIVPEPATVAMAGLAGLGMIAVRRRMR